jgi:hypothetical protein
VVAEVHHQNDINKGTSSSNSMVRAII